MIFSKYEYQKQKWSKSVYFTDLPFICQNRHFFETTLKYGKYKTKCEFKHKCKNLNLLKPHICNSKKQQMKTDTEMSLNVTVLSINICANCFWSPSFRMKLFSVPNYPTVFREFCKMFSFFSLQLFSLRFFNHFFPRHLGYTMHFLTGIQS